MNNKMRFVNLVYKNDSYILYTGVRRKDLEELANVAYYADESFESFAKEILDDDKHRYICSSSDKEMYESIKGELHKAGLLEVVNSTEYGDSTIMHSIADAVGGFVEKEDLLNRANECLYYDPEKAKDLLEQYLDYDEGTLFFNGKYGGCMAITDFGDIMDSGIIDDYKKAASRCM